MIRTAPKYPLPQDLTPAGCTVLAYVSRQKMRFCQHISHGEIVGGVGLPRALADAGLLECLAQGWLVPCRAARGTSYTLVADPRPTGTPLLH